MSRSSVAPAAHNHIRRVRLGVLAAAMVVLAAPVPASAAPRTANTFDGSCSGQAGWASFPEQPLTTMPVDMLLLADLSGGQCSGTLNGRDVEGLPARATAALRGPQSCSGG